MRQTTPTAALDGHDDGRLPLPSPSAHPYPISSRSFFDFPARSRATPLDLPSRILKGAVDQASAALLCYKVHRINVSLPILSADFWRYLPACALSDLVAIAVLQILARWVLSGRRIPPASSRSGREPAEHGRTAPHDYGGDHPSNDTDMTTDGMQGSHRATLLDGDCVHEDSGSTSTYFLPTTNAGFRRRSSQAPAPLHSPTGSDVWIDGRRLSITDPLLEEQNQRPSNKTSSAALPGLLQRTLSRLFSSFLNLLVDDQRHSSQPGSASIKPQSQQDDSLRSRSDYLRILSGVLLFLVSLSQIIFAVIAIGAFEAGDIVVTWDAMLTFNTDGRTDYLVKSALQSWYCFAGAYTAILGLQRTGGWLGNRLQSLFRLTDNGLVAWALRVMVLAFITAAIVYRPPRSLTTNDLLWEAVSTCAVLSAEGLGFLSSLAHDTIKTNPELYGRSNIFEPRVTPLDEIRHVFIISLESADNLAWPYSPDYCKHRGCDDIPPEYDNVEHMTPFFASLINRTENVFYTPNYKANIAYTAKSHFGMACGQLPHFKHMVTAEVEMDPPLPCLPDVLRAFDPSFRSAHWTSQDLTWDNYEPFVARAGYDRVLNRTGLQEEFLKDDIRWPAFSNYFGYSEKDAMPYMFKWLDERIAHNERAFVTMPGNVMHYGFSTPPNDEDFKPVKYSSKAPIVSDYLNAVRWTDGYLRAFFQEMEKRGLLKNSLVIVAGDHGPRLDKHGAYHTATGHWDSGIFQVPLLVHAPGLQSIRQPVQPFLNMDILPTVLDAVGVDAKAIGRYSGHSFFRARGAEYDRVTFHAQNGGANFRQVTRRDREHSYKAIFFDQGQAGDVCATDLYVDPEEELFYCVKEGWRKAYVGSSLEDGLSVGLWQEGSKETEELISWAHEAADLLEQHFAVNAQQWKTSKAAEHAAAHKELLSSIAKASSARAQAAKHSPPSTTLYDVHAGDTPLEAKA